MKNKFLFIVASILLLACQSYEEDLKNTLQEIPGAVITYYDHNPDLALVRAMSGDRVVEEGEVYKGKKHGSWILYYNNGLIREITNYSNGNKEGAHISMNDRNQIEITAWYVNDLMEGKYLRYINQKKKEEKNYAAGKLEGEVRVYYPNGKVAEESFYKNGNIDGVARWYDQQGNVSIESIYENGELIEQKTGDQISAN